MSGLNGMDAARKFRETEKQTVLIFITALEEYVFQAFDMGAFHYLVKPFSEERFDEVFHLALSDCLCWCGITIIKTLYV